MAGSWWPTPSFRARLVGTTPFSDTRAQTAGLRGQRSPPPGTHPPLIGDPGEAASVRVPHPRLAHITRAPRFHWVLSASRGAGLLSLAVSFLQVDFQGVTFSGKDKM